MIPKSVYNKLSKKDKAKVKNAVSITSKKKGRSGAYIFDKSNPFGHYGEKLAKYTGLIPRSLGAYVGHGIGKLFGSGAYYNSSGKYIPSYTGAHKIIKGSGAYYNAPKNVVTNSTSPPSFGSNRTIIRHREFIGNILGSTTFSINKWNVNPGDETTFPWLSTLATNYEKYRPIGIIFEFKSTSANALNSTNTALGTVMMAPRYNAITSSEPSSKMEMLQIENCVSICPAESAMCGVECAKNYNPLGVLYVRRQLGDIDNEQMYDFCDFYLATEGMQAVATIGELWITYEIELLTPILGGGQKGLEINYANYSLGSGISNSNFFASASSSLNISNMTLTFTGTSFSLPSNITDGCYMVSYYVIGSGAQALVAPAITYTNCQALNIVTGNTLPYEISNSTGYNLMFTHFFQVTGSGAKITYATATFPTGISSGQLIVTQIPDH